MRARAPYLEWAKSRPPAAIDLARSDVVPFSLEEIPGAPTALSPSATGGDGYPPLLDAIARAYGVSPERVALGNGCAGANFLVLAAVLEPGDEVLIESPTYDPLIAAAVALRAQVSTFERRFEEGYALDLERIESRLTGRVRVVVLTSPHNPSGALVPAETLDVLGRILGRRGVLGLVDEVYLDAVLGARPAPAALHSPAFVSTNSLTKSYGLSSLRCGWSLATAEIATRIRRARDVVDGSGVLPAEKLAASAFSVLPRLAARAREILEPNRRRFEAFLATRPEIESAPAQGPLAFPRFCDGRDADDFARKLFDGFGVAVVPGSFFGSRSQFRISLAGDPGALEDGLEAIAKLI